MRTARSGFELLDHRADIGVRAFGPTVESAFIQAARGMFAVMVELDAVRSVESHDVALASAMLDELLVDWLSDLLAQKDLNGLVFGQFEVSIRDGANGWRLAGRALGERLDRGRHDPRAEVKGISHLGLSVQCERDRWTACAVFDV